MSGKFNLDVTAVRLADELTDMVAIAGVVAAAALGVSNPQIYFAIVSVALGKRVIQK